MAIADGGELLVLALSVAAFGEDREIDRLIRKYGYRTTPQILEHVRKTDDLPKNLSAAAYLIRLWLVGRPIPNHLLPGKLTREEIESVGYQFGDLGHMLRRYDPQLLGDGWNTLGDGERIYFVRNPALGRGDVARLGGG